MYPGPGVSHPGQGLPNDGPPLRMDTADRILETAEALIQERGYFGFSFADIAQQIGIRKASIYYHFPAKAELGRAVVDRYRTRMRQVSDTLAIDDQIDHWKALSEYLTPLQLLGRTPDRACLCAVLGGEYLGLPDAMQSEVAAYFAEHQNWLEKLLASGRAAGAFRFSGDAKAMSQLLFSAIVGGILIKRTNGDTGYLDQVIGAAQSVLGHSSE